jgi:hypothetical protein
MAAAIVLYASFCDRGRPNELWSADQERVTGRSMAALRPLVERLWRVHATFTELGAQNGDLSIIRSRYQKAERGSVATAACRILNVRWPEEGGGGQGR